MPIFTQTPGFARGELAPELRHRADLAWYRLGLGVLRNRTIAETGGAPRRTGTGFTDERRFPAKKSVGIPFIFSTITGDTYTLEFGDFYMEVIRAGARVTEAGKTITGITQANPAVVTSNAHGFANDDDVILSGIVGMTELNGRRVRVANVTANTFEIKDLFGANINSTGYGPYASGGTAARVYKIPTPYSEAEVERLGYSQKHDVMTLVHPSHQPRDLSRLGHASWSLALSVFFPVVRPFNVNGNPDAGNVGAAVTNRYRVTAVLENGEETLVGVTSVFAPFTITAITKADPAVVTTATPHNLASGDKIWIGLCEGMTEVNDREFTVEVTGANTFKLVNVDSTGYGTYTGTAGQGAPLTLTIQSANQPTEAQPNTITWVDTRIPFGVTPKGKALYYNIYKEKAGVFGFVGEARFAPFLDKGFTPLTDPGETPPEWQLLFRFAGNYPSVVTYHQQRRFFAAPENAPTTIFGSRIGYYSNFTVHTDIQDDDAIVAPLDSGEVNPIRHLLPMRRLLALTGASEWAIEGDDAGTITPSQINARPYSYEGSALLRPLTIGNVVVYLQARRGIVRDLAYEFGSDSYAGRNRALGSGHLLRGHSIVDWAFQKTPASIIWMVRDDGVLLSLTYLPEQEIFAWARHDTDGAVERVVVIPENDGGSTGGEDAVYLFTRRTVNGQARRYIERMERELTNETAIEAHRYLDSALTYDGRNAGATTLTLGPGTTWAYDESIPLTASAPTFATADLDVDADGKPMVEYWLKDADGVVIRCKPVGFTSSTVITVKPHKTVPASLRNTARTTWSKAVRRVSGLWHLEAKAVAAVGDGFVVASPNNPDYATLTVATGKVTLPAPPRAVIHVGLPYTSDFQTLDIEVPEGESLAGKPKQVRNVLLHVRDVGGGVWVGSKLPDGDGVGESTGLKEHKARRNGDSHDLPVPLRSEPFDVPIPTDWNSFGRVAVRVADPVPGTILGVVISGLVR